MERLTKRAPNGLAYLAKVRENEQAVESSYPNTLKAILEAFNRLAAYEDIGTPEEFAELREKIQRMGEVETCQYDQTDDDRGVWECSECGEEWVIETGNPFENNMQFCPKCGRLINSISWEENQWDDETVTRTLTRKEAALKEGAEIDGY